MITPNDIAEIDKNPVCRYLNEFDRDYFMRQKEIAERRALELYRQAVICSPQIKRIKVELDCRFPEKFIVEAVEQYRNAGWKKVTYSMVNITPTAPEPDMTWVITLFKA